MQSLDLYDTAAQVEHMTGSLSLGWGEEDTPSITLFTSVPNKLKLGAI